MKNKPAYGIESVDHALRLATILQQEGPLRVTDAAERIGVARSTAHRLLSMLVYRDFAEQNEDRRYVSGPVLSAHPVTEPLAELRRIALPRLEGLTARTSETSNLLVVTADQARFVASVECDQALRVGDREGRVLPAHLASGGRAVLATMAPDALRALYESADSGVDDVEALLRGIRRIRRQGFALNDGLTETGLTAIGCLVTVSAGSMPIAISLAMPTARYRKDLLSDWVQEIRATADGIARDLEAAAATREVTTT
ncbi:MULTISPECIES: IclR family transcriptional regulator [unclassified Pseudonocardia]|uniref:IclR family transcriptional regulator n=1 Tax=unclassified Pseudonocardia TaxID=2619320 RepID=UPI0006CB0A7D|nr:MULTISPECIES: IclR family transcriptional regulator C-terminal domain-containing protein [unclassified Pseudonocardia]ALE86615.1 transcriptional regulator [Pseudonocardia sp. HH130629-09]ANY10711.1 transcriptional regulator [Pseudonocardia sp. HH130630-07]